MAKFRCNETGNVIEFSSDYDVKAMRNNTEYTEVIEELKKEAQKQEIKKVTKE
jgi:hypothetical protein